MSIHNAQGASDIHPKHLPYKEALPAESGIAILNLADQIIFCDESFLLLTGKTMRECQLLPVRALFPSLHLPQISRTNIVREKVLYQDITSLEITFSPMRDADEQFTGTSVLLKKIPVSAATAISPPFQTILEVMPHLAWTSRPDGGVSYVNHKWAEYTGMQVQELLEWGWQSFFHPEDIDRVLQKWKQAVQTGEKYECEYRFRKEPEGIYRWLLGRALPVRNETGQITLWVGTCTDIHEQKLAEEALEKRVQERTYELSTAIEELNSINEQLFQEIELRRKLDSVLEEQKAFTDKITHLMPCLITVYNINTGKYIYVNQAIELMLGYSQERLLEQGASLLISLLHPEEAESLMASNQEALQKSNAKQAHEPEAVVAFEYRLRHSNGKWRWLHTSGTVFDRDANGKVAHVLNISFDVTEKKVVQLKLQESETRLIQLNEELEQRVAKRTRDLAISQERYEIASYVTHNAIWDWNLITDKLTYSKVYSTIFGYSPHETLNTIEEWKRRIHPEDKDRVLNSIQGVIDRGEQVWQSEYRHQRKDSSYAYVLDRGFVQQDTQGKPLRMVGAMADITERKQAEETILKSEAKFRRIFESDMLGIFLWEVNGLVIEANDRFLQMIGYTREDMAAGNINWVNLTPPAYLHIDQELIQQLLTTGSSAAYEKEYIRKDGSLVPIMIGGVLLQGDIDQGVAYVLDITEQKKAQQNLALSEERFRLVTRATNDAVRDWNLQTDVIWWNEGFKNMFGYLPEEIEVGPESWYSRIHPDDLERVLEKIHHVIESKDEQWSDEYRFRRADGTYAYILDRTYILHNEQGKAIRMLGSMVDVTYMKEIQEALEQQATELKQSNADLEQFAFISSHDLQEPLNTAASFAKLLEKRYKHILDADGQEFIKFIVTSTDRMKMLIRSLLNYSKINAVAKTYELTNLSDLARVATDNLQARLLQTQAQVVVEELPEVPVVASQIVQLFQNLISNAIKFKSTFPPKIHISAREQAEHVLISVQDNGIGMDMKYAGKIFQVFQRLHSRDEYEGAGIGLATCKRIVERHHGNIWVESAPGKGAIFFFTLRK